MTELTRDELLVLLIEECGEVIQAATKCLRFGFDVDHGVDYGNNRMVLSRELGDLMGVVDGLDIDHDNLSATRVSKLKRARNAKARYGVDVGGAS
jgi:hypothetical protein